jgi:hypothetical protein
VSLLIVKLLLAPLLVVCSSLAGRRWGHELSGLLVALPLVAGPILLITDLERGASFGARAAGASLLGLVALASFVVVFARISRAHGWPLTVLGGWIAFLAVALAFSTLYIPPVLGLLLSLGAFALAPLLMPPDAHFAEDVEPAELPAWDLPARAVATALLVVSLTGAASGLGPTLTGVLTPSPISTTVLAAFVLVQSGPQHASSLLRGFLRGAFGFTAFCFLVAVLLRPTGTVLAFSLALFAAVAAQLIARQVHRRRAPATIPEPASFGLAAAAAAPEQPAVRDSVRALP